MHVRLIYSHTRASYVVLIMKFSAVIITVDSLALALALALAGLSVFPFPLVDVSPHTPYLFYSHLLGTAMHTSCIMLHASR